MENKTSDKMNILTVLVNLRNDIKNWCTYHFNEKLDNTLPEAEKNRMLATNTSGKIVTLSGTEAVNIIGAAPKHEVSTQDISVGTYLPSGTLYVVYED